MSCGVGRRCSSDPELLWLCCRPVATALIGPLAWEPSYAMSAAPEKTKKKKKSLQIINAGEGEEKREFSCPVRVLVGAATMENSMEVPQKTKNRITI